MKKKNKFTIILTDNEIKTGSGLNEEITLHPSSIPSHPSLLCLFWFIISIGSEEVLLIEFFKNA